MGIKDEGYGKVDYAWPLDGDPGPEFDIKCVGCGSWHLHQRDVFVYTRKEDAKFALETIVDMSGSRSSVKPSSDEVEIDGNPSHRRHGLRIRFECEQCDDIFDMVLLQHKGTTELKWRFVGKRDREWGWERV